MKKYCEESDPSTKCEIEFYRHERMFLLQPQNAFTDWKQQSSTKYCDTYISGDDVGRIEARPKKNDDIRKGLESGMQQRVWVKEVKETLPRKRRWRSLVTKPRNVIFTALNSPLEIILTKNIISESYENLLALGRCQRTPTPMLFSKLKRSTNIYNCNCIL